MENKDSINKKCNFRVERCKGDGNSNQGRETYLKMAHRPLWEVIVNRGLNEEEKKIWGWIFQPGKEQVQNPAQWKNAVLNTHLCSPRKL